MLIDFFFTLRAAKLGVQPVYFRPPYSIDQEPDTNDQAAPVDRIQSMGYVILGNKIDTNDWDEHPRKTPMEITDSVFQQMKDMEAKPWNRGSVILLHDGGERLAPTGGHSLDLSQQVLIQLNHTAHNPMIVRSRRLRRAGPHLWALRMMSYTSLARSMKSKEGGM